MTPVTTVQNHFHKPVAAFAIVGIIALVSVWYYALNPVFMYIILYIWFGFAYGMVLQWGRFCFASAFRDLFSMGVTRMFVGIMIAMGLFLSLIHI